MGPFELYGSVGATISNAGFSASFAGGANINIGASTINIASASGYFAIDGIQLDLDASVSIAGISYSFYGESGTAPTPPSNTPGLQVYSVPSFAGAEQQIELSAEYYATNGSDYENSDYMWVISECRLSHSNVLRRPGFRDPGRARHVLGVALHVAIQRS